VKAAALVAVLILTIVPTGAQAADVSRDELIRLANSASTDREELDELRAVTSVDGVPVDLETILSGAKGEELDARLDEIIASAEAAPVASLDADEAQARVEEILAGEPPEPPPAADGDGMIEFPALSTPLAIVIALIVIGLAAVATSRAGQRTILEREAASGVAKRGKRAGARDLAREADEAERRGDFAAAVRLRFQAGLTRLDELGSIELRPSLTASGAASESGIREITRLAEAYERVAFGGRDASENDASVQRAGWSEIVDRARGRT